MMFKLLIGMGAILTKFVTVLYTVLTKLFTNNTKEIKSKWSEVIGPLTSIEES